MIKLQQKLLFSLFFTLTLIMNCTSDQLEYPIVPIDKMHSIDQQDDVPCLVSLDKVSQLDQIKKSISEGCILACKYGIPVSVISVILYISVIKPITTSVNELNGSLKKWEVLMSSFVESFKNMDGSVSTVVSDVHEMKPVIVKQGDKISSNAQGIEGSSKIVAGSFCAAVTWWIIQGLLNRGS